MIEIGGCPVINPYGVQVGTLLGFDKTQTKQCRSCNKVLSISEFGRNGYRSRCKKCFSKAHSEMMYKKGGVKPIKENKKCSRFLGEHISEKLLASTFKNVVKAETNNKGYDFICGNGFKVDVKASCLRNVVQISNSERVLHYWQFFIRRNDIADYFACIAFDNRESLTPVHYWIIPGKAINKKLDIQIHISTLHKWAEYEKPLDKLLLECGLMKNEAENKESVETDQGS